MTKPFCLNVNDTKSDTNQFSSPVPLIGLYITGATSVCILLMLFDMISGLRRRTRYIPCRLFSLNSVTLTLLGVATKLPVDLTSYMPSALDQLSKLTGTTVICIYMGFILPSLGSSRKSESISNLIALGILVLTVFVNICIQMSTKVIFSFVIEHVLILCFMLVLYLLLWDCTTEEMKNVKDVMGEKNRQLFEKREGSLMHRVKRWYMYSCMYNPQLLFCRLLEGMTAEIICVFCSTILLQAAYRSLSSSGMEFCKGTSDYGWSMRAIIISQIAIIIVGCSTIAFRWLTLARHMDVFNASDGRESTIDDFILHFYTTKLRAVKTSTIVCFRLLLKVVPFLICKILVIIVGLVPFLLSTVLSIIVEVFFPPLCQIMKGVSISSWKEEFQGIVVGKANDLLEWIMVVSVKDMSKWRSDASKRFSSGSFMAQMLSRPRPSVQSTLLNKIQEIGSRHSNGYKVTCLSMVLLVKIVDVLVPSSLSESLRQAMDEAFEVIYFIDERINIGNFEDRRRREVATLLWNGGDLNVKKRDLMEYNTLREYVFWTLDKVHKIAPEKHMETEVQIIRDFIQDCNYTSVEELCDYIYQLFVHMSRLFLTQFPTLIFKEVHESPVEDYEERSRFILKLLFKLEPSLEDKVQWSFPVGANITRFLDPYENFDEGIPSDTTMGDAAAAEVPSMTDSIPSIQDVEVGHTPLS